ncbi:MAG: protein-disulfide reductase DsbD family protein [Alphaproteobacteria bacterium]
MSFISSGLSRYLAAVPAAVTAMLSAALLPAAPAWADASFWMQGVQAEVRVISAFTATGETETTVPLGLEFQMNEGWHIYWRTPGEAGLPPELDHGPSLNVAETAFSWPVPTRDVTYGIETFVYKDRVVLPLEVSLQSPGEPLDLRGKVDFLICADVCIPDSVEVDFSLPGGAAEIAEGEAALLNTFETRIPADNSGGVGLQVESIAFEAASDPENPLLVGYLDTRLASVFEMTAPDVFAEVPEGFSVRQPEVALSDDAMMAQLRSPVFRESWAPATLDTAAAVITVADGIRGVELPSFRLLDGFSLASGSGSVGATGEGLSVAGPLAPLDLSLTSVLGILVLAVIGGFILNFMPCVLPVLSLKMFSVVSHGGQADARIRLSFAATALGILVSFLALALAFAGLKLAGASFGWGVQFTQPAFILVLLAVLVGFALNLFGLFEIPNIPGLGGLGANQRGFLGDFTSGVLATLLATPCSAPFLGTAIGFALAAPVPVLVLIFLFVGVGLALPYFAVIAFPRLAAVMPKPGRWMLRLRQVLGLALVATAVWLTGVLLKQWGVTSDLRWLAALAAGLTFAAGALFARWRTAGLGAVGAAIPLALVLSFSPQATASEEVTFQPFSKAVLEEALAEGKTVFVDVTADWCLTCKTNKIRAINHEDVQAALGSESVISLQADWTAYDASITRYLASQGRRAIPFNAVYNPKSGTAEVLPELLSPNDVLGALARAR